MNYQPSVLLLVLLSFSSSSVAAREVWYRGLDLESRLKQAELVVVVRVAEVTEIKVVVGGKGQQPVLQQFTFQPVRTLKGFYSRDTLLLTSDDLGRGYDKESLTHIERGQMRLLVLGRSGIGYDNRWQAANLDQSMPPLRDENDALLSSVEVLLTVNRQYDRVKITALLLDGLRKVNGPAAIPLLAALQRRALLAAQITDAMPSVLRHIEDAAPAVREAAAQATEAILAADYLNQRPLREAAVSALVGSLDNAEPDFAAKVAALRALGVAGDVAARDPKATALLPPDRPCDTSAEQAARLRAAGKLRLTDLLPAIAAFCEKLPLDASYELQQAAGGALLQLDAAGATAWLQQRLKRKWAAGLPVTVELQLFGELPSNLAAPALLEAAALPLDRTERAALAAACERVPDARLVPTLATMLDPRQPDIRYHAVNALQTNDTAEAANALRPHLGEELELSRKLQLAEFLGRHGIRDGYPYAIEHMNPYLEQAVAALAAIREPKAVEQLRGILETSNDVRWNSAAVRALGRLGAKEFTAQFLKMAQDLKDPLAPSALIALADLGEPTALPIVRDGLSSRNDSMVWAGARAAGKLLALPGVQADDVRDQLASLLAGSPVGEQEAFEALRELNDGRINDAMRAAVRHARLEGMPLLARIEELLQKNKVPLNLQ